MKLARLSIAFTFLFAFVSTPVNAGEWKPLFNGTDLSGWTEVGGGKSGWKASDGELRCTGKGGWLSTADEYDNFELELEFQLAPGANSGVFIRAPHHATPKGFEQHRDDPAYTGMEIQVLDDADKKYSAIKPWQRCGSVYGLVAAKPDAVKPAGEWQKYHITCDKSKIKVELNGKVIVDADLAELKSPDPAHVEGMSRAKGYIGLQIHGGGVAFRNIRLRTL